MNRNHKAILELCKFQNTDFSELEALLKGNLDFPYILGQLLYNRMGGVAFYVLEKGGLLSKVNREFRNALQTVYESYVTKTESYLHCIDEIGSILSTTNVPYAALKGAYLAGCYPRGLRTSNDVDLLLEQKNVTEIANLLKSHGFKQGNIRNNKFVPATRQEIISSKMNRGETIPFIKEVSFPQMKFFEIDINFSLDFQAEQKSNTIKSFLERAQPLILTDSKPLYTLEQVDFIIHLCAHLYKEATTYPWVAMGRDLSLYKFCDLYFLLEKWMGFEFYKQLSLRILQTGLQKECYYALLFTKQLFSMDDNIDQLLKTIEPDNLDFLNQIIKPDDQKLYCYDMDFMNWLFCDNRLNYLKEVLQDEQAANETESFPGEAHYFLRFGRVR